MKSQRISRLLAGVAGLTLMSGTAAFADQNIANNIHPGDQLNVTVYGEPTLTQQVVVAPDATIDYPMVGKISLANDTPAEASVAMKRALANYLRNPIVAVSIVTPGQLTVMVLGNVKTPGKYQIPYHSHVTDAIAAAGGLGPTNGAYPAARITDTSGTHEAQIQDVLRGGNTSEDVVLDNNSVVYIPEPETFNVEVLGAVDKPGEVSLNVGDHLTAAIAKAGNGVNSNADLNAIRVSRDMGNGVIKVYQINLYDKLEKGDRSADIVLQKNDVVYVPKSKQNGSAISGGLMGLLGRWI
jgi:polysaccharide export outer membrane protein